MDSTTKVSYMAAGSDSRGSIEEKLKKTNRNLIYLFVLIVVVPFIWSLIYQANLAIVKDIDIQDIKLVSPNVLCPGDTLSYSYHMASRGKGVLILDQTIWKIDPPKTIIYSMARRFIMQESTEHEVTESWVIPELFFNYETAIMEPLGEGNYRRFISISSPSRTSTIDTDYVDFAIGADCGPILE